MVCRGDTREASAARVLWSASDRRFRSSAYGSRVALVAACGTI